MRRTFSEFSPDLQKRLEAVGHRRAYSAGQEIFGEGMRADFLPIVLSGTVKMIRRPEPGKEIIIGTFRAGDLFAIPPVFDGHPYPASAIAAADTTLLQIGRDDFLLILRESNELGFAIIAWMCEMLREKTSMIRNLAKASPDARVATILVKLTEAAGGEFPVRIRARRQDIAEMASLTTETTIRVIRRFAERGLVRIDRGKIIVEGLDTLRYISQS